MLCPNCQQDTFLQGKDNQVCINCGYSIFTSGVGKKPIESHKPAHGMSASKKQQMAPKHQLARKLNNSTVEVVSVSVTEKKASLLGSASRLLNDKTTRRAAEKLREISAQTKAFASTYRSELLKSWAGPVGRALKFVTILLGLTLAVALLLLFLF